MPTIKKNTITIDALPKDTDVTLKVKTNSKLPQRVTIKRNGVVEKIFSGTGEKNTIQGEHTLISNGVLEATFEYQKQEQWLPAALESGGPYNIGQYRMLVVVSESSDDSDYNDAILELSWSAR